MYSDALKAKNIKIENSSKGKSKNETYFMECKWNPCLCNKRVYGFL